MGKTDGNDPNRRSAAIHQEYQQTPDEIWVESPRGVVLADIIFI